MEQYFKFKELMSLSVVKIRFIDISLGGYYG